MKILAIDSSGMPASVAVCEDGCLTAEYTVHFKRTHSQTLVPMMEEVRRMLGLDPGSVDAIAVAGGPGSFTGLRIGSAVAKGVGLAMDKPLIHVPTLEAMACNYYGSSRLIVPMMDARNRQVFAGIYMFRQEDAQRMPDEQGTEDAQRMPDERGTEDAQRGMNGCRQEDPLCVLQDQEPVTVARLCERLNELSRETGKGIVFLGDGAVAYRELIEEHLRSPHSFAPAHLAHQRAGSVAVRGLELARQGKLETAAMHRPDYLRVSQAERVRAQKMETGSES